MPWDSPAPTYAPILEHCPIIFTDSSEDDKPQSITEGCAPEFAQARWIERRVQKLMQDLKGKHKIVVDEHRCFTELQSVARQVFSAVYMCKTELETAANEKNWEGVRKVKNILSACQKAVGGYTGDTLWDHDGMDEENEDNQG